MDKMLKRVKAALTGASTAQPTGEVINWDNYRKSLGLPSPRPTCLLRPSTEEMVQPKLKL